ncbi:MAG: hypothetical protein Q4B15_01945 [Lachnospiraceae bacterium]|nr:hypothetical protein [Lachnospiraceae bacterium]
MSTSHLGSQGVQLVFANPNDIFYRDDLVRLNLRDFLYAELRERRIDKVLFVRRKNTKSAKAYAVEAYDEQSYRVFVKEARSVFESFKQIDRSDYRDEKDCTDKQILQMMREYPDTAFIITAEDFQALFQNDPAEAAFLKEGRGRSLLILAAPNADKSLPLLSASDSVFRTRRNGVPLFPELDAVFSENQKKGSYFREFQNGMQNQCLFLNRFTKESLENVVRYSLWKHRSIREYEEEDIAPTAEFIAAWYRSPGMQNAFPGALTRNARLQFRTIEKDVRINWSKLKQFREIWEQNKEAYPVLEERPLYSECMPVMQTEQIYAGRSMHLGNKVNTDLWNRISYYMQVPAAETMDEKSIARIESCLDLMLSAENQRDEATVRYGERCLEYWLSPVMEKSGAAKAASPVQREKIKNTYEQLMKISSARFALQQKMAEIRKSIQTWEEQKRALYIRITNMAEAEGISLRDPESEIANIRSTELFNAMFEYTDLKRRIDWNRGILNKLLQDATQYQKSLTALETTIQLADTIAVEDMDKTLEESREILLEYGKKEEEKQQTYQESVSQEKLLDDLLKGRFTPTLKEELQSFNEDIEEQVLSGSEKQSNGSSTNRKENYTDEELQIMNEF